MVTNHWELERLGRERAQAMRADSRPRSGGRERPAFGLALRRRIGRSLIELGTHIDAGAGRRQPAASRLSVVGRGDR